MLALAANFEPGRGPGRGDSELAPGSDSGFGFLFAALFAVIGAALWAGRGSVVAWPFAVSGAFVAAAVVRPGLLGPLNRAWFRFGLLLSRIVSPVVLAALFYAVVTPTGLAVRLLGKDPLRLRFDRQSESYWIHRTPPGPEPAAMRNQF